MIIRSSPPLEVTDLEFDPKLREAAAPAWNPSWTDKKPGTVVNRRIVTSKVKSFCMQKAE